MDPIDLDAIERCLTSGAHTLNTARLQIRGLMRAVRERDAGTQADNMHDMRRKGRSAHLRDPAEGDVPGLDYRRRP